MIKRSTIQDSSVMPQIKFINMNKLSGNWATQVNLNIVELVRNSKLCHIFTTFSKTLWISKKTVSNDYKDDMAFNNILLG